MNWLFLSILSLSLWLVNPQTPQPVVRAILFYSPQCGHCHYVIEEVLPPLVAQYGLQLAIVGLDVTQSQGSQYFQLALQKFNLESAGVPFLVVGDEYLIGSVDIPERFPALIESYLAQGGVDYPDLPGLREEISASEAAQAPTQQPEATTGANLPSEPSISSAENDFSLNARSELGVWERIKLDPIGNGLAIIVLVGMLAVLAISVVQFQRQAVASSSTWQLWLIPILSLAGFVAAGYLAYVETAQVTAVCGPVGDCNTVQRSEYARLFGILPIGVLGLLGYIGILAAWLVGRLKRDPLSKYADLALLTMTAFGLLFSIYLTFLEPFVIGATCAWCLTSAIIMTALFALSLIPGKRAWQTLGQF